MAMARASTPVRSANSTAWSGSVMWSRPNRRAVAVFHAAQHADFAFYRDAALVREVNHLAGDFDVLFKCGGFLPSVLSEPSIMTLV